MGIDTATLRYQLNIDEAKYIIDRLVIYSPHMKKILYDFLYDSEKKFGKPIYGNSIIGLSAGIQAIYMYHDKYERNTIYLCITINLSALLLNKPTCKLFFPTSRNIFMLQTCYANAIFYLFPECFNLLAQCGYRPQGLAAIPFIALGILKRLDLTANMYMPEHKSETLYMLKKTALCTRHERKKLDNNNTYFFNASSADEFYDKQLKCEEKYCPSLEYYEDATNIIRFEHSQRAGIPELITTHFMSYYKHFDMHKVCKVNMLTVFHNKYLRKTILHFYSQLVGIYDWYCIESLKSIINNSSLRHKEKMRLIEFAEACSKEESGLYGIYLTAKAKGQEHLRKLKKTLLYFNRLNVQPVPIPDEFGIKHIVNPMRYNRQDIITIDPYVTVNLPDELLVYYNKIVLSLYLQDAQQKGVFKRRIVKKFKRHALCYKSNSHRYRSTALSCVIAFYVSRLWTASEKHYRARPPPYIYILIK